MFQFSQYGNTDILVILHWSIWNLVKIQIWIIDNLLPDWEIQLISKLRININDLFYDKMSKFLHYHTFIERNNKINAKVLETVLIYFYLYEMNVIN